MTRSFQEVKFPTWGQFKNSMIFEKKVEKKKIAASREILFTSIKRAANSEQLTRLSVPVRETFHHRCVICTYAQSQSITFITRPGISSFTHFTALIASVATELSIDQGNDRRAGYI